MRRVQNLADGRLVDDAGNLISCAWVDFRRRETICPHSSARYAAQSSISRRRRSNRSERASANVGTPWARRLSARGSPPARASLRLARASSRASAKETRATLPSPISRRRPRMTIRWIQLRVPSGLTWNDCGQPRRSYDYSGRANTIRALPPGKSSTSGQSWGMRPATADPQPAGTAMYCRPLTA